jgi:hypothetical protein
MVATMALAAGVLGGIWWLARGARRAARLYRCWRWRNSIAVYGYDEPGRAWQIDASTAAVLALAGPFVPDDLDAARAWRRVYWLLAIVWLVFGGGLR